MARPFLDFVHPDDLERTAREAAKLREPDRELSGFENRYRTRAGGWRWLRWSARSDGETWFAVGTDVTERREAEQGLRQALVEERLLAYSQPIVDRAGRLVQEELLVRLQDSDGTVRLPAEFLPEAERSGLIVEIDRWMSARDCASHGADATSRSTSQPSRSRTTPSWQSSPTRFDRQG